MRDKVRLACTANNPAVTTVPNVKVKVTARHSIPYLSPYDILGKPLLLLTPTHGTINLHNETRCEVQFFKVQNKVYVTPTDQHIL